MDFSLTDEQQSFKQTIFEWSRKEIAPESMKLEHDHVSEFIWDHWRKMGAMGLLGLPFPEEYGGQNAGALTTVLAMEAATMGGMDSGTALSWGAHTILCGVPIWQLGTEEQKQRYLPKLASGEWVGGFGLTEPEAGSDAADVRTTAVKKGDRWILNGTKMFITNGPIGQVFVIIAQTDPSQKAFGISAFIVESGFKGYSVGRHLDKMGNRTSPTSELIFEDCEVPEENLLGPENFGFVTTAKLILEWERSCMLAPAVGAMERGLMTTAKYSLDRRQFNKPIGHFQATQAKLADMRVSLDAARQLVYRVAWMKDNDQPALMEASIAKLFVSEAVVKSAEEAIQIHGGYGYMREYLVERGWRDAKLATIGAGTSEIQRSIIARLLMDLGY